MEENYKENNQFVCYFCNDLIKNDTPEVRINVSFFYGFRLVFCIYVVESHRSLWTCVGALPEQMWCLHTEKFQKETFKGMPQCLEVHGESHWKWKP